jgi:hypothetical protein
MKKFLVALAVATLLAAPASAKLTAPQKKMKSCNSHASGMTGSARKHFMSTCLSGKSQATKGLHCTTGKPCGNTCIDAKEVCHQ